MVRIFHYHLSTAKIHCRSALPGATT